jgi:MFS family permease
MSRVEAPAAAAPAAGQRSLVWILGLGAFGLAFSLTVTAAYLPPLLGEFTGSKTLIALVLAAEGAFALTLPVVIGPWSDGFHTPLGRRRPFMLVAVGPMGFCLALLAFMPSFWTTALLVFAFFFAYYVYEPPYRGLYPDVLRAESYGRSQGVQHILRGIALGAALVGGGFLFHVWHPWPFLTAAVVTTAACLAPVLLVREDGGHGAVFRGVRAYASTSWALFRRDPVVRRFLFANAAWEAAFAAARTFVVLYVVAGLDEPLTVSSLVLAAVAVGYVVAALAAGRLGTRFGIARVILVAAVLYGGGYVLGGLAQTWHAWYLPLIFGVAIAGGLVMTLAWALLFELMPADSRGGVAGLATTTKGLGLLVGPLAAGAAIDMAAPHLQATDGYQVLWPLVGVLVLVSVPLIVPLVVAERRAAGDGGAVPAQLPIDPPL